VLVGFGLCLIAGLAALMAYVIIDALTDGSPWLALGVIVADRMIAPSPNPRMSRLVPASCSPVTSRALWPCITPPILVRMAQIPRFTGLDLATRNVRMTPGLRSLSVPSCGGSACA
jgi:hypothetical protein